MRNNIPVSHNYTFTSLVEIIGKDGVESSLSVGRHTAELPDTVRRVPSLKWRTSLASLHLHLFQGAVPMDVDKATSLCKLTDTQPIRGMGHDCLKYWLSGTPQWAIT